MLCSDEMYRICDGYKKDYPFKLFDIHRWLWL